MIRSRLIRLIKRVIALNQARDFEDCSSACILITYLITQRMSEDYLTIKQAAAYTSKAEITIRRFVQRVVKGSDPERRALIQPTPEELQQHREGPQPAWRISTKLLDEYFATQEQGNDQPTVDQTKATDEPVVAILKSQVATMEKQLTIKDEQLKSMTTLVATLGEQLNERLRESNVLMKGLQERVALPGPSTSTIIADQPKPSNHDDQSQSAGESEPDKPKGWLQRLFGSNTTET